MNWSRECAAIIPCLNEARTIAPLVQGLASWVARVIVVDDGSSDGTFERASAAGAEVIRRRGPRGKGEALQAGFARAAGHQHAWAIALDGDGQHLPGDLPKFFAEAERSGAKLVVGNRMLQAANMPRVRRWVNRWMSSQLSGFCGVNLPDSQCGFRLVHLPSWRALPIGARRFEIESELFVRFAAARLPISWVPVETRYGEERSKIAPFRDSLRWFSWWMSIRRELGARPAFSLRWRLSHDSA